MDKDLENFELYKDGEDKHSKPSASRLESLQANRGETAQNINKGYSRFIRKVQIALPVLALLLIALIFGMNSYQGDKIIPIQEEDIQPQARQEIGKNELVNPQFESMDEKGQPFKITADTATQNSPDQNSDMLLQNPSGTMNLKSGDTVSLSANKGNYKQLDQYLDLNENVILTHSGGYQLTTNTLQIDLAANKAWSNQTVRVTGPEGEINANGLEVSSDNEKLTFKGPAKMLLTLEDKTMDFGEMLP